jgi:signal transduction histidine kinase
MRMRDLINGELGEVRLRTGAKPVPEHVGLADLLDEITATTRHEAKKSDIQFTEEVDHQLELDTDPQLLISVVSNIIQNAIKYSRAGGRVSVHAYSQNGYVVIEVADSCGGIPEDKFNSIFQPFLRGKTQQPGISALGFPLLSVPSRH